MAFAWSRVAGQLISGCIVLASARRYYRPGFAWSALSLLFRFGFPLAVAGIVNSILLNLDYALVGHLLGAVSLGFYVLAFNAASWPASLLFNMISNVSIPAFSRVKHDGDLLKDSIMSAVRAISLVIMPISALIVAFARPIILILYGTKWAASADVLSVLSIYGAISIMCVLFANIIASLGRARFLLAIQVFWLTALVPAMALGVRLYGIMGAATAHIAVIGPLVLPSYLLALKRTAGVRFITLAEAMMPALVVALAAALGARAVGSHFTSPLTQLVVGLAVGGLIYLVAAAPQVIALLNRGSAMELPVRRWRFARHRPWAPRSGGLESAARRYRRETLT
jgi:lipopolysaccharide exporter